MENNQDKDLFFQKVQFDKDLSRADHSYSDKIAQENIKRFTGDKSVKWEVKEMLRRCREILVDENLS